jgi:predicted RecB family nuclease
VAPEHRENPPWSWSVSRRGLFRECPRRYYYHYYGYHDGWLASAPDVARRAYRLRNLKSLPLLVGEVLHALFGEALRDVRGGKPAVAADTLFNEARRRLNVAYAESKNRKAFEAEPKGRAMLHELYYGTELADSRIDAMRRRLRAATEGFLASPSFREAGAAPFQEIKGIDHEGHFELDGTRIYAAPDLTIRRGDGTWVIVDWKTGAGDEAHATQLGVYGLYLRHRHGVRGPVAGRLEYVSEGTSEDVAIDEAALEFALREIRDSVAAMRAYLDDPAANRPRPREAFPLRDDRRACPQCNFYELCRPEIEAGLEGPF